MSRRRKKKVVVTQCERCDACRCAESRQIECARLDFLAICAGTVYECPDYVAPYWERMCA